MTRPAPWTSDQLSRVLISNFVGLVVVLVGAYQAGRNTDVRSAMSWLNVSLAGVAIAGAGNALWLMRARQVMAGTKRTVLDAATDLFAAPVATAGDGVALVKVPGTIRVHRPMCALVAGKAGAENIARNEAVDRLVACEVCEPEFS